MESLKYSADGVPSGFEEIIPDKLNTIVMTLLLFVEEWRQLALELGCLEEQLWNVTCLNDFYKTKSFTWDELIKATRNIGAYGVSACLIELAYDHINKN